ncbi:MAG: DNA repair protein RecO [Fibrobacteres bacterium]|nr:DNA repair protein RecO [Fibrobacterota bacterium]
MALQTLRAVILRRIAFGDTSWILHVHAQEEGRLSLLARGARRPQSPLAGSVDPLTLAEFVVSAKPGRDLQTLTQAVCLDPRSGLHKDLAAMAAAMVCAETVLRLSGEGQAHPGLFAVLESALSSLDRDGFRPAILWAFLGRFSDEMGWAMAVDHCPACGSEEIRHPRVLSLAHGGFLCGPCGSRSHQGALADRIARALEDSAHGLEPAGDPWTRPEIDRIEDLWFEHILRHSHMRPRLESRQFLAEVRA